MIAPSKIKRVSTPDLIASIDYPYFYKLMFSIMVINGALNS
jgi:hypothetical protein